MAKSGNMQKYVRFIMYLAVVILLNIVGMNLFFRADLTKNRLYSLSDASKDVVSNLREPLTIKVFFTKDLPPPHNNTEQYIHDLLNEYDLYANQYFNYQFYNVSTKQGDDDTDAATNQKLANEYGIHAVQIQNVEKDEVKFMKAYMGMVLINGDLVEQIPTIADTQKLEYQITTAIRKLNNKISALLKLKESIKAKLYLSSSLKVVAPYIELEDIDTLPDRIEKIIATLNATHFGKLAFEYIDPSVTDVPNEELAKYQVLSMKWPELDDGAIPPGQGAIGLVLQHKDKVLSIPLINVMRIPLLGTQYNMTDLDELGNVISQNIESLIDINEDIGYLASHGTLSEGPSPFMNQGRPQNPDQVRNFKQLASQNYTFKDVDLKKGDISDSFNCMIIANPGEQFSDYELFQIDQYLMRGNNLAVFLDAFKVIENNRQQPMMNQGPMFLPQKTGLEKLLAHYGIAYETSYVMDKNCYKQRINPRFGGGERPLYFAPVIENQDIAHDLDFMKSIKGLIAMRISPLVIKQDVLEKQNITAHRLFSSSDEAWEMKGRIQLNPDMIHPPVAEEDYQRYPLGYLLEGGFESYFKGKPIPEKKSGDAEDESAENSGAEAETADKGPEISPDGAFIEKGKPGKILLIASAEILKDNMIDEAGQTPNALFLLNVLDELNGRTDTAVLRGKEQRFDPLEERSSNLKTGIKFFNILGLPVLVVLFGLSVWLRRHARKRQIQMMFGK